MFEQMRIAALALFLVERSGVDPHADRDLVGRDAIVAHCIAHAVGQFAEGPFLIARDIAALVDPRRAVGGREILRRGRRRFLRKQGLRSEQRSGKDERETPDGARKMGHEGHIGGRPVKAR